MMKVKRDSGQWMNDFNLKHLHVFWVVVQEGAVSQGARRLGVAQSAVSLQIAKLEEYFREPLLKRDAHTFQLTPVGKAVFEEAQHMFSGLDGFLSQFRSEHFGKKVFRLGAEGGISKVFQLQQIQSRFPSVLNANEASPVLVYSTQSRSELIHAIRNHRLDGAILESGLLGTEREGLRDQRIGYEQWCWVGGVPFQKVSKTKEVSVFLPGRDSQATEKILSELEKKKISLKVLGYVDDVPMMRLLAIESGASVCVPKVGVEKELLDARLFLWHEFRNVVQEYFWIERSDSSKNLDRRDVKKGA